MYAWIWRMLPFGRPGKIVGSLLLAGSVTALMWYVVFPLAETLLPFDDVQVTQDVDNPGGPADQGGPAGPGGGDVGGNIGDNDVPYPTDQNNPEPSATPRR